jgi:hypothetical protein
VTNTVVRVSANTPTQADWDRTNDNYTLSFYPVALCVNDNYVFVIQVLAGWTAVYCHVLYRSNFTLKGTVTLANIYHVNDALCDDNYLYVGGKAQNYGSGAGSICGWNICKYSIPDLAYQSRYFNSSWNFPELFIINETYVYACGSKISSTAAMLQIYSSNMTEKEMVVHDYHATAYNYYYYLALSPDEQYLYGSVGVKSSYPGYIGRHNAADISYVDSYCVASSGYFNMQTIITIPNGDVICHSAASDANEKLVCVDENLNLKWELNWVITPAYPSANSNGIIRLRDYNATQFFAMSYNGSVYCRNTVDGSINWSYTGFSGGWNSMVILDNFLYIAGSYGAGYMLRNVSIGGGTPAPPVPPPTITFVYPCSIELYHTNPTLIWTIVSDARYYYLQIANDSLFTDIVYNITHISLLNYPAYYSDDGVYVYFTLPPANSLSIPGSYHIRVKAAR